ncbi:MAG: cation:proton antiporter [Bacteroidota bacterium]
MDTHVIILGAGLIIILSYLFNIAAQRTNIPSVLMLMLLGFAIKPFVPIEEGGLRPFLEVLGTVGVILIVLEAALDLHLEKQKAPMIYRSLLLAAVLLLLTTVVIALGLYLFLEMSFFQAMVYATPLAVMSSAIIIPSVHGLSEAKKEFLTFESAFSDILGIVLFYSLIGYHEQGGEGSLLLSSLGTILITIILSVVITYVLIILFQQVKGHIRLFLLIGILLAIYSTGKLLHLSPLILILFFGLTLNNKDLFFQGKIGLFIDDEQFDHIVKDFRVITLESAFVVRTFFFVIFGMSIVPNQLLYWSVPGITLIALLAIYGTRWGGLRLLFKKDIEPEIYIAPRGLITILLFYAIPQGLNEKGEGVFSENFQPGILLLTILITSFIMSYGLIKHAQKTKAAEASSGEGEEAEAPAEMLPVSPGTGEAPQAPAPPAIPPTQE